MPKQWTSDVSVQVDLFRDSVIPMLEWATPLLTFPDGRRIRGRSARCLVAVSG